MATLFLLADPPGFAPSAAELAALAKALADLPGLTRGLIMVPDDTPADQPFASDGRGPALALQLDCADDAAAAALLRSDSPLLRLPALARAPAGSIAAQAMRRRAFATGAPAPAEPCLTFLVTYEGEADDPETWLDHYDAHHPPIMVRFPAIREVETFRPLALDMDPPFTRATAMQRNKVVFDSLADLVAALAAPIMAEMRADGRAFPAWRGRATHFPMTTRRVAGRAA